MRRPGWFLGLLLALNACAIARHPAPIASLEPVPSTQVVMLATVASIPASAARVAVFTPAGSLRALSDPDLLEYYAPEAGLRGANHVFIDHVNGRRIVRAYYLRVPQPVAAVPTDSAQAPLSAGGSSASPGTGGSVRVRGYYRRDGTYVRPHTRSRPGSRRRN